MSKAVRLFPVEPGLAEPDAAFDSGHARWTTSIGALAEIRLIAELLGRGHRVAQPVSDDDGVDLIVNYRTCVQVKSCARPREPGSYHFNVVRYRKNGARSLAEHVD